MQFIVGDAQVGSRIAIDEIYLDIGKNIGGHVSNRIKKHLNSIPDLRIIESTFDHKNIDTKNPNNILILSIGDTLRTWELINKEEFNGMPPESFWMKSAQPSYSYSNNIHELVVNGLPLDQSTHRNISFSKERIHYGAVLGAYAALEYLGYGFLHPLDPFIPNIITIPVNNHETKESPYWPERGFHIHTQHPLELTEVLQGHDIPMFGPHGKHCVTYNISSSLKSEQYSRQSTSTTTPEQHCERWEDMVGDVDHMFEWAVANRLNKIEWLLLGSYKWIDLDTSAYRQKRLRTLTQLGHEYSLLVGADIPIGNIQQHAWSIVNTRLPFKKQVEQIEERVNWVFGANFDFLTTESGLSEFTHPECSLMLDLLNAFADVVNGTWGREAAIKVHISTGQRCHDIPDPRTGEPINFNFLPMVASKALGVFPHTVQVYSLHDPSANTYGNVNFQSMEDYMFYEAGPGNRSVQFYGETSYWVNVDIDVPLFLPLYGFKRQEDLRIIAARETRDKLKVDGQMNFDSGWEWGYWLMDVVTARASWQPVTEEEEPRRWDAFRTALAPLEQIFVSVVDKDNKNIKVKSKASSNTNNNDDNEVVRLGSELVKLIARVTYEQERLLVFGQLSITEAEIYSSTSSSAFPSSSVASATAAELYIASDAFMTDDLDSLPTPIPASNLTLLSGMAYLSGDDTWVDVPRMAGLHLTQPDKLKMTQHDHELWPRCLALLAEMDVVFTALASRAKAIKHLACVESISSSGTINSNNGYDRDEKDSCPANYNNRLSLLTEELLDCVEMLAHRAHFVRLLYESRDPLLPIETKQEHQSEARRLIAHVQKLVRRRESQYRVPWQRIASWRENPTVYRYGYLWAVHSLYFWWRDIGIAAAALSLEESTVQYVGNKWSSISWFEKLSFSFRSELSPCYLNRMDVSEVSVGFGRYVLQFIRYIVTWLVPFSSNGYPFEIVKCFAPPMNEYRFPADLAG